MARQVKQTLLTGFGAFGTVVSNPTERLITHFAGENVCGHELTTCVLPVSYARAPKILAEALVRGGRQGEPFDVVWLLGVAAGSPCWRVEALGRNQNGTARDCDGVVPEQAIDASGPATRRVTVPTSQMVRALTAAGLPAAVSRSAGGYLCNHILYKALGMIEADGLIARAGFLHVPSDEQTLQARPESIMEGVANAAHCFSFDQHVLAVRATLTALAKIRRRPAARQDT